jgi:hypothetical protein
MERPNCRYRESLEKIVRDAVAHEKELESTLPEPEARKEALEGCGANSQNGQMVKRVFWLLRGEHGIRDRGRSLTFDLQSIQGELIFVDTAEQFYASDRDANNSSRLLSLLTTPPRIPERPLYPMCLAICTRALESTVTTACPQLLLRMVLNDRRV